MKHGRALLTDREREALRGDGSDSYEYKTRTYLRSRLQKLVADAELLADEEPELYEELQEAVAAGGELDDGEQSGHTVLTPDAWPGVSLGEDVPEHVDEADATGAVAAAADYIFKNAPAEKSEITSAVRPNHPLGYGAGDDDGRDRSAWWCRIIRPGLQASGFEYTNGSGWKPAEDRETT